MGQQQYIDYQRYEKENEVKKIFISTLFLLFVFAQATFAHSYLKASNPTDGQIIDGSLSEIILNFDTVIEPSSLLTLTNEGGKEIPVSISVNNDTMIAKFTSPLEDGTYQVNYNIIGEDGHPMSGSYLFMVSNSESVEGASEGDSSEGSSTNWFMIFIGAIVIILILAFLTKQPNRRRRRY